MPTYTSRGGRRKGSSALRDIMIIVVASLIVSVIPVSYVISNTTLIVELDFKGIPVSGTVNVVAVSGQGQGMSYVKNGSSVEFFLHDGIYHVFASYTNSTGYTFSTGYWTIDLTYGNILITHHMTIELFNNTAWY